MKQFLRTFGVALFLVTFGVLVGGGGAGILLEESRFAATALTAPGTVVGHEELSSKDGSRPTYRSVVRFTTADGQIVQFVDQVGKNPRDEVGGTVTVVYSAGRPGDARVQGSSTILGRVLGGIGGLALLAGIILLVRALARSRRQAA